MAIRDDFITLIVRPSALYQLLRVVLGIKKERVKVRANAP